MSKTKIYIILGAAGSGRREVVADLVADLSTSDAKPMLLLSEGETRSEWDERCGTLQSWSFGDDKRIHASISPDASDVFLMLDGRKNPVDQLEACKAWIDSSKHELARILCVVNCQLAEAHQELMAWYDACIHFADVVLLNRREGVSNRWISEFRARYEKQFYPCIFEFVKEGRVKNPALILEPQARRISQAFEEEMIGISLDGVIIEDTSEDEEDNEETDEDEDEEKDLAPQPDPYFARRLGGRRVKEIPNIADYLG